jgi:hypothetical protein
MADLSGKSERVFVGHGVTIHRSDRERRYVA